jgi:predicted aspartyl protease
MTINNRIILSGTLLALLTLALPACKSTNISKVTSEKEHIKTEVLVPLIPYAGRLKQVEVYIGGKSYPFLFDTGGGLTLISPKVASDIGCLPYGRLLGHRMSGEIVQFEQCGKADIIVEGMTLNTDLGVFDLMALLPEGLPPLHGVLSLHTFQNYPITIDLKNGMLTIESPESLLNRVKQMNRMKMSVGREIEGRAVSVYIISEAGQGEFFLLLDSGNLRGTLIAPHTLELLGYPLSDVEQCQEINLHFPEIGTFPIEAEVVDLRHDGVVGAEFMEGLIFTLDISEGKLWVQHP